MLRTVVLLDKNKTYVTDSEHVSLEFPLTGDMQADCPTIEWDMKDYNYLDRIEHETDEEGAELYHYIEAVAAPVGSAAGSTTTAKSGPGWSAA